MNLLHRLSVLYFSRRCSYLIFFVTSRCNARCNMCFNWKNIEQSHMRKELALWEIEKITKNFHNLLYITLGGGEPFLREDLAEIVYAFYRNSGTRFVTISTNGSLPSGIEKEVRKIMAMCKGLILKISLSLDGFEKTHNSIRGMNGLYAKVFQSFEILKRVKKDHLGLIINFATVLTRFNKDELSEFIGFMRKNYDYDDHTIALVRGDARDCSSKDEVDLKVYREAVKTLRINKNNGYYVLKPYSLVRAVTDVMFDVTLEALRENRMVIPCLAGKKMLVLDDIGQVWPCEIIGQIYREKDFKIGSLRESNYDISKIVNSSKAKETVKFIKEKECFCSFECATLCNIACNFKMLPRILKRILQWK